MSFLSALYTLIISPLELLFEVIFMVANRFIGNEGLSIIVLSLAVNFLVLPLYKRADELQAEERDIQAKMADRIKRTKQTFKGDERFMMLQEYYRINKYKPIYALKSSASLLLQIPFFIAAYRLLSGMQSLQGMSFGFITDLGKEDAAFMIGSFPINILPIVMTLINIVTGIIYTKGQPLKSKIQVYGLAVVFLVLLYHSPAGLVFYWLLNNVFALVKNLVYKLKKPEFMSKLQTRFKSEPKAASKGTFFAGAVFMAMVTGFLIPTTVIRASVEEFIDIINPANPMIHIAYASLLSFGSWVLWGSVFYFFVSDKMKAVFTKGIWILSGVAILDYMLFGTDLGVLSSTLQYKAEPAFSLTQYLLNTLGVIAVAVVLYFVITKFKIVAKMVLVVGILAVFAVGFFNSADIWGGYTWFYKYNAPSEEMPYIPLSKNGKNVVVLMIDRSLGTQVPYVFNEKPELLEQFDGFTYYPNTISYGAYTLFGAPALYGGYEYTPDRINARPEESLVDKHNEALRVMPEIFGKAGYEVTICDPSFAGYNEIPVLSIYDDHPEYNTYITRARFNYFDEAEDGGSLNVISERVKESLNRNLFCFSVMKVSPLFLQGIIYDNGLYNDSSSGDVLTAPSVSQKRDSLTTATGFDKDFIEWYPVLTNLPNITTVSDGSENTFCLMVNKTSHSPCLLQEPDYVPAIRVDNTQYDVDMVSRYTIDGVTMQMTTMDQVTHYQSNMATYIQLGKWFDYLREQGVWDNTRIILVADHGYNFGQFGITCNDTDMEFFMPLLMVKDFDATGFTVCEDFMTNGDTPVLATEGLIEDPVNPFTGNPITSDPKNGPQTIFFSDYYLCEENIDRNTFRPGAWFVLEGDPHDPENWEYVGFY